MLDTLIYNTDRSSKHIATYGKHMHQNNTQNHIRC